MMRRVVMVLLGVCTSVVVLQSPAAAEEYRCPDGVLVDVTATLNEFTIAAACAGHMTPGDEGDQGDRTDEPKEPTGTWVYDGFVCDNGGMCASSQKCADGSVKKLYYFLSADGQRGESRVICPGDPDDPEPRATPPTPGQIFTAFKDAVPTTSALAIQPPNGQTLVNLETIFSTKADPFTTQPFEVVPGYTIELDIYPTAFFWNFGDGEELTTDSAGKPWESGADVSTLITHVYTSTNPVEASVTTRWGANVRLNGGAPVAVEGTVDKTSPEVPLEILEATPQLVN